MRFFHRFLLAGAIWAVASAPPTLARAQDFVACSKPAAPPSLPPAALFGALSPKRENLLFISGGTAQNIFRELTETYTLRGHAAATQLVIESTGPHANAYVKDHSTIVITPFLLAALQEHSALWFVLAHEMAHIALQHPHITSQPEEAQADALAVQILRERNIDPCSALHVLEALQAQEPGYSYSLADRRHRMQILLGNRCISPPKVLMSLSTRSVIQ